MCDCVEKLKGELSAQNTRLVEALQLSKDMTKITSRLVVATEKIDKKIRNKPIVFVASYCPFCGTQWAP